MRELPAYLRFRSSERLLLCFFVYIAVLTPFFHDRVRVSYQPIVVLTGAFSLFCCFSFAEQTKLIKRAAEIRDWLPFGLTLVAFREMDFFVPQRYDKAYEAAWIQWDRILLEQWHLRAAIESLRLLLPCYLELCYLLVYGVGAYCILVLWFRAGRKTIDRFYIIYLTGTLLAYSLFPYFPSQPPRIAFPDVAVPHFTSVIREVNVALLQAASIHSAVFPSAHVSSTFAAAWAMFVLAPQRKRYGWGMLVYAISVSVATIYGRYHYAADVAAGFVVSVVALVVALKSKRGR